MLYSGHFMNGLLLIRSFLVPALMSSSASSPLGGGHLLHGPLDLLHHLEMLLVHLLLREHLLLLHHGQLLLLVLLLLLCCLIIGLKMARGRLRRLIHIGRHALQGRHHWTCSHGRVHRRGHDHLENYRHRGGLGRPLLGPRRSLP